MQNITNIIQSFNEISIRLASNVELQKLLVVDDYDLQAAEFQPLTIQELLEQHYICNGPQNENAIKQLGRNTFLIITLQEINFNEKSNNVSGTIFVVTDLNHSLISNYEDRGLKISNLILGSIDDLKLSASIKLHVNYITRVTYTKLLSGYAIHFSFADQTTKKAEL